MKWKMEMDTIHRLISRFYAVEYDRKNLVIYIPFLEYRIVIRIESK